MSAKLGEMLLKVGALTRGQLEQVLQAQSIYGGRLGTNLVEMGFISEEELAHVLGEQTGTPCVEPAELNDVSKSVLATVPNDLVRRYRVVPIAMEGKRLALAMADPHDFKAAEEIGFVTGLIVRPRICTERRLNAALERFYNIRRPERFVGGAGGMNRLEALTRSTTGVFAQNVADATVSGWDSPTSWLTSLDQITVKDVAELMAAASTDMEVVQTLTRYVGGEFDRGGFLRLKEGLLSGVEAVADGLSVHSFAGFETEIGQMEHLQRMVREKGVILCEFAVGDAEGSLVRAMGGELPAPALLLPVSLGGHVVGVICASDSKGRLGGGAFELQRVGVMAELSLEMLSLRRKIKNA